MTIVVLHPWHVMEPLSRPLVPTVALKLLPVTLPLPTLLGPTVVLPNRLAATENSMSAPTVAPERTVVMVKEIHQV